MQQNLQFVDPNWDTQLKSYFSPLPNHHIFTFILGSAVLLILAVPLIIINASILPQDIKAIVIAIAILASFLPLCFSCTRLIRYYLRPRPTDQEYDAWVSSHESQLLIEGFRRINIDKSEIVGEPLCIKEIIWPDDDEAKHYYDPLNASLSIKWDVQGIPHASANRFIFLYPTRHTIEIFICEVNIFLRQRRSTERKYFYKQIVGIDIVDVKAPGYLSELTRQLEIKITSSDSIHIPIPLSDTKTKDNVENFVKSLKAFLRENH